MTAQSSTITPKIPCTCGPIHDESDVCPFEDECYEEWLYTRFAGHSPPKVPDNA